MWPPSTKGIRGPIYITNEQSEAHLEQTASQLKNITEDLAEKINDLRSPHTNILTDNEWRHPEHEEPNINGDDTYYWLLGGTFDQFRVGLANFLTTIENEKKREWIEMVLLIARHEMRKKVYYEGMRDDVIHTIRIELVKKYNNLEIPKTLAERTLSNRRGDSLETIRTLLCGRYTKKDIKNHFLSEYK